LLLLCGCAHSAAAPAPVPPSRTTPTSTTSTTSTASSALDDLLLSDIQGDHAFPWSVDRRLVWSDFQGTPPSEGREGAKTTYALYSAWKCRGDAFQFRVVAGFRTAQSWVKPAVLKDSVQSRTILAHEQVHFDLAEVHARLMRRYFAGLTGACRKSDAQLTALAQRLEDEASAEQRRYDTETNHGLVADRQAQWSLQTRRRLAASQ
jgi:uncharacterized protein DUF922